MTFPSIIFPRRAAPNANAAMDQLFDLFHDHYPVQINEDDEDWTFELRWPTYDGWYIDTNAVPMANRMYGLSLDSIPIFTKQQRFGNADFLFSMIHSRAIIVAARATHRRRRTPLSCIVHIDDHTDLMPPVLAFSGEYGKLVDVIYNQSVDLSDPLSVSAAVDRGVISKGNFLAAYLIANPPGELIHISKSHNESSSWLDRVNIDFELAGRTYNRTDLKQIDKPTSTSWRFLKARTIPSQIDPEYSSGIWLDVDLDEFCNRYNGDSNSRLVGETLEEKNEMIRRIDAFLMELSQARWISQIEAISVAVSPGFFPSDYWSYAIPKVCDGIKGIVNGA